MCNLCQTSALEFGDLMPGWLLCKATVDGENWFANEWGLVNAGQQVLAWSVTPTPDPFEGMSDDEIDIALSVTSNKSAFMRHQAAFEQFKEQLRVTNGLGPIVELVGVASQCGWSSEDDGCIEWWLFTRMGAHLAKIEC